MPGIADQFYLLELGSAAILDISPGEESHTVFFGGKKIDLSSSFKQRLSTGTDVLQGWRVYEYRDSYEGRAYHKTKASITFKNIKKKFQLLKFC